MLEGMVVQNDSIIVTGDKLLQTIDRLEIAESTARSLIMGNSIGEILPMGQEYWKLFLHIYSTIYRLCVQILLLL